MNYVICAYNIDEEIENNLLKLGVIPVKLRGLRKSESYGKYNPLSYHPDMFCFNPEKNIWIFYDEVYKENKDIIAGLNLEIEIIEIKSPESYKYPDDIGLNAAIFGEYLICNIKYTNDKILKYAKKNKKNVIDVRQGYAKCSICVVDEKSIITSDEPIYKKAILNDIEALLINSGHINLNGYDYGFIGGCSGLIDKNKLAFTGDIKQHPDYINIKNFCEGRGVEIISLSGKKLYDYGSLFAF